MKRIAICFYLLFLLDSVFAEVPPSVKFDPARGITIAPDIVKMLNMQAQSINRDKYIGAYEKDIESPDEATRAFAVWALSNFQSQKVVGVLLNHAKTEKVDVILEAIAMALGIGEMFDPLGAPQLRPTAAESLKKIERYRELFGSKGYPGVIEEELKTLTKDGQEMLESYVCDHYDPALIMFLLDLYDKSKNQRNKAQIASAVLSWSGFDVGAKATSEIRDAIKTNDGMNKEKLADRYNTYFRAHGYGGSGSEMDVALAALYSCKSSEEKYVRGMALRLLEIRLEKD